VPDLQFSQSFETFDWFILALRAAFIFLVYFFLWQVARVTIRELVTIGVRTSDAEYENAPSPGALTGTIEIIDPAMSSWQRGATFSLDHFTSIGRYENNAVVLDDDYVSGAHAEIMFEDGDWWLRDVGSTNGTLLNNRQVGDWSRLSHGDIVEFGRVRTRALL